MQLHFYDEELGAVISVYEGFLKFDEFKEIASSTLGVIRKTTSSKILVNTSQLKVMVKQNQDWINDVWFPEAKRAGVRYMAFLVPEDIFGKISMEATNKQVLAEGEITIEYFDQESLARNWLKSVGG
ncbi:hypothetical protein [Adhaeribacter aquaticus]|uniref:hypothetical protein n=1 Tax=Adhaeribacter aquaticus TaxID=299567 RepID=UPI0003FD14CF|nr:hypothetical protein [Adhaeribacter aquaticus]